MLNPVESTGRTAAEPENPLNLSGTAEPVD
jgi:hypothetical protein